MKFNLISFVFFFCWTLLAQSAEMKNADRMARTMARKELQGRVLGALFSYKAQFDIGSGSVLMEKAIAGVFNSCKTDMVKEWPEYAMVKAKASISQKELLENLKRVLQKQVPANDLATMMLQIEKAFPQAEYVAVEYGCGAKGDNLGKTFLKTRRQNQMEATKELLTFFKGPTVQGSSRLEDFVLTQDSVIATAVATMAGVSFEEPEPDFKDPTNFPLTATMTRSAYIASINLALGTAKSPILTAEEIQKLQKVLPESHTVSVGEADAVDFGKE
ncbi:MAG: hypothetical protein AABZ60_07070 [Planctomycetota bacterium]